MFRKEHGKINVTSLVERVSRYTALLRNEDRRSKPIMESLIQGLSALPADARQSITFDRGTEFSAWQRLKDGIGADSWFCDPQAPWQKGTVENTNNRLRKILPRSTEPSPSSLGPMAHPMATADKSIFKVDLPAPQRDAPQMPGLQNACRSLRGQARGYPEPTDVK